MKNKSLAVVIVSNGPGELATWVKPVVDELNNKNQSLCDKDQINFKLRLVLVPCPNATGKEFTVANSWNKFELITKSNSFWKLLINPYSFGNWPKKGVVRRFIGTTPLRGGGVLRVVFKSLQFKFADSVDIDVINFNNLKFTNFNIWHESLRVDMFSAKKRLTLLYDV